MRVVSIKSKVHGAEWPGGFGGENFLKHCLCNPDEFTVTYAEADEADIKQDKYSKETLKTFGMPALRDIYKILAEDKPDAPAPTTSVDGIIKAIMELQGE